MKALADAIWTLWDNNAPLKAALPRLYSMQAPPESTMPYGVFWRVSEYSDRTFADLSDETTVQFDVFVNEWTLDNVFDIETKHKTAFDGAALVVAGRTHIVMLWEFTEGPIREDECWHTILQYRVRVQE